ncbi:dolichol-phosphate mannosyltransferase subunit 3-like isoform X2 [Mizuhopecten yessoensis]|uniref:dolichol-phosphate mannosyltransferase subunit 3-like isoform X2 n=1 Tax=Mizuhopecten yessoensis TaxID=6573 RepID=UPI000B457703|nr:dolichol-phosphate mannosyltransferase subunit 3-like isoform X2 [Mizuhopecten yessoensis]
MSGIPKLFQWLFGVGAFLAVWLSLVLNYVETDFSTSHKGVVLFLPLYLLITFACVSLAIIGYRVATFNDSVQASEELQQQIEEAKADLKKKGFKFVES